MCPCPCHGLPIFRASLLLQEVEQIFIDLVGIDVWQSMRRSWVDLHPAVRHHIDCLVRAGLDGNNLIIVSHQDQNRNVHLLQVFSVILLPRLGAIMHSFEAAHHALLEPAVNQSLALLCALAIEPKEGTTWNVDEELCSILNHGLSEAVEDWRRNTFGVVLGLHHLRWIRADEHSFRNTASTMAPDVARNLSAAGRVANEHDVLEIEMLDKLAQIVCPGVHVIAEPGPGLK